jgi:hypothetical protein
LLRAWDFDDSSSTTISVERAHRQNSELLRGKQHVNVRKSQSQCVLAAHCRQHEQTGGRAMTDYVSKTDFYYASTTAIQYYVPHVIGSLFFGFIGTCFSKFRFLSLKRKCLK